MSDSPTYDLLVIGGGAAGFFGAIEAARLHPGWQIAILEKTSKLLAKVAVSGGGRCNVTHRCTPADWPQHYPRGGRFLKKVFRTFDGAATVQWFVSRGIDLKAEADGRVFPVTNRSQTIIDCFMQEAAHRRIKIFTRCGVERVEAGQPFQLYADARRWQAARVLVAVGGHAKAEAYRWLEELGLSMRSPIPSLFTFNDPSRVWAGLMGLSAPHAAVKIVGTKFSETGPVLITHWGLSGPAVIKLSAWAAEFLHERNYHFDVLVNWVNETEETVRQTLLLYRQQNGRRAVRTYPVYPLPSRLWQKVCADAEIGNTTLWNETSHKQVNRLIEKLVRSPFAIRGKTTFKEEFVTCGGISLDEIDPETMACKKIPGLYVAGEVLDIDGETGGFNFQAAWSTATVAARAMA